MPLGINPNWAIKSIAGGADDVARAFVNRYGHTALADVVQGALERMQAEGLQFGRSGLPFGQTIFVKPVVNGATINYSADRVMGLSLASGSKIAQPLLANAERISTTLNAQGRTFELINGRSGVLAHGGARVVQVKNWGLGPGAERTITSLDGRPLLGKQPLPTEFGPLPSPDKIRLVPAYPHFTAGKLPTDQIGATILTYRTPRSFSLPHAFAANTSQDALPLKNVLAIKIPDTITAERLPIVTIEENGVPWMGSLKEITASARSA